MICSKFKSFGFALCLKTDTVLRSVGFALVFSFNLFAVDMARVECPAELVISKFKSIPSKLFPGGNDSNQEK